jgi:hypothetical protein
VDELDVVLLVVVPLEVDPDEEVVPVTSLELLAPPAAVLLAPPPPVPSELIVPISPQAVAATLRRRKEVKACLIEQAALCHASSRLPPRIA